jgi:hypothetical protein
MPDVPLFLLSPEGNRDRATRLIRTATDLPELPASTLALTLDGVSAAVLRTAGVGNDDARAVLAELWHPRRLHERPPPRLPDPRSATAARDREFLRRLGERVRMVRCARGLSLTEVWGRTGLEIHLLRDVEAGAFTPSAVGLRRLAEAFTVPVSLLMDDTTSPAEVLHQLAPRSA